LPSYVPSCHENLENKFTTNLLNGTITGLRTRPPYTEMEFEPLFHVS
jgi:hypothetical protein